MNQSTLESLRQVLCQVHNRLVERVTSQRGKGMDVVVGESASDVHYAIDRIGEEELESTLTDLWPSDEPVEIVGEGIEAGTFFLPRTATRESLNWRLIVDPIDGTRNLMTDRSSAFVLTGLASLTSEEPTLRDIDVAVMTEIPPIKQRLSDQLSCVRGMGVRMERVDLDSGTRMPLKIAPSEAADLRHGFTSIARYFPEGRVWLSEFEERLIEKLYGVGKQRTPIIFDNQCLSTGGQFFALITGRDRMAADLRPIAFSQCGLEGIVTCHPYDACCALLLQEAGCLILMPDGSPFDAPMDDRSPVSFVAFASPTIRDHVWPTWEETLRAMTTSG